MSEQNYLDVATKAARLERDRDYKAAEAMWLSAQSSATKNANVVWCETRASICKHRAEKNR